MLAESIVFLISLVGFSLVIPQILRVLSTENIKHISVDLLLVLQLVSVASIFYGLYANSLCISIVNLISSLCYSSILYLHFNKERVN